MGSKPALTFSGVPRLSLRFKLGGQQQVLRAARQLGHLFLDVLVAGVHVACRNSSRPALPCLGVE